MADSMNAALLGHADLISLMSKEPVTTVVWLQMTPQFQDGGIVVVV